MNKQMDCSSIPLTPTIHLHDPRWKKALRPYCKTVENIIRHCEPQAKQSSSELKAGLPRRAKRAPRNDISVVLSNDAEIRQLNKQYRGKDKPTNVLSFPNDEEPLGDVILAYETIEREAQEQGKSFRDHVAHLIVHGILHLMGYDHEADADATKMERREILILKKLGIENPY